jgi:hypothetical protein
VIFACKISNWRIFSCSQKLSFFLQIFPPFFTYKFVYFSAFSASLKNVIKNHILIINMFNFLDTRSFVAFNLPKIDGKLRYFFANFVKIDLRKVCKKCQHKFFKKQKDAFIITAKIQNDLFLIIFARSVRTNFFKPWFLLKNVFKLFAFVCFLLFINIPRPFFSVFSSKIVFLRFPPKKFLLIFSSKVLLFLKNFLLFFLKNVPFLFKNSVR